MFEFEGLDHVVLRVRNIELMLAFYAGVLGCAVEKVQERIGLYQLRAGDSLIDLLIADPPPSRNSGGHNLDHFCLRLKHFDAAAIHAYLADKNVKAGEAVSRYGAHGQGPSIYIEDPEGNVVELKAPAQNGA